jgi:hypothetical protein
MCQLQVRLVNRDQLALSLIFCRLEPQAEKDEMFWREAYLLSLPPKSARLHLRAVCRDYMRIESYATCRTDRK